MEELQFTKNFIIIYVIFTVLIIGFGVESSLNSDESQLLPIDNRIELNDISGINILQLPRFVWSLIVGIWNLFTYTITASGFGWVNWIMWSFRIISGLEIFMYIKEMFDISLSFG